MKFKVVLMMTLLVGVLFCGLVCAQYSDTSGITNSLDKITDWLTKGLGAALVIIGIVVVGIRMSLHDPQALQKGIWVVVGGLLIFLAKNILNLIKGFSGVN